MYLSTQEDPGRTMVFDHPNLIIYATSAEQMLALKARAARAARAQDLGDVRLLAASPQITEVSDVVAIVEQFFPDDPLNARDQAAIEDLFN